MVYNHTDNNWAKRRTSYPVHVQSVSNGRAYWTGDGNRSFSCDAAAIPLRPPTEATMNIKNAIATFETDEDAKEAGYKTRLTRQEANSLLPLNRKQRRAELAKLRHQKPTPGARR